MSFRITLQYNIAHICIGDFICIFLLGSRVPRMDSYVDDLFDPVLDQGPPVSAACLLKFCISQFVLNCIASKMYLCDCSFRACIWLYLLSVIACLVIVVCFSLVN